MIFANENRKKGSHRTITEKLILKIMRNILRIQIL